MNALYLEDAYMKEFTAVVKSVKDGKYVVLDQTAFYPNAGGQPYDKGKMVKAGEQFSVVFVGKFSGEKFRGTMVGGMLYTSPRGFTAVLNIQKKGTKTNSTRSTANE